MKVCTKCQETKALDAFSPNRKMRDGKQSACKVCCKLWQEAYRLTQPPRRVPPKPFVSAEERKAHKAAVRKAWVKANVEKERAKHVRYREANIEKARARGRGWYWANVEHARRNSRAWSKANPVKVCAITARRRVAKTLQVLPCSPEAIEAIYERAAILTMVSGVPHDVDHIVPLKGKTVRGLHVPWNLRCIPATDNRRKHNRLEHA